jgi:HlyD family secretion protein
MSKSKNNRLLYYLAGGILVLIIIAVIGKKAGFVGNKDSIKVTAEEVIRRTLEETVSASGKIQPEVEVSISSDVSGEIIGLSVKEGDSIKKGDLLVKIEQDLYLASIDRATAAVNTSKANLANSRARLIQNESRLRASKSNYNRSKLLFNQGIISASDWEQIESEYETAFAEVSAGTESVSAARYNVESTQASLKEARENLDRTSIYSPMDGVISRLDVELGERVVGTAQMTGTEMLRVANLDMMEVVVEVNENDINRVSIHDTVVIEVDAFDDEEFKGTVTEIASSAKLLSNSADQVTNFEVKIRILKTSYAHLLGNGSGLPSPFRPGLSATVEIMTNRVSDVLCVPIQSVTTKTAEDLEDKSSKRKKRGEEEKSEEGIKDDEAKEYVFVLDAKVVKLVEVKTGIQNNTYIQIKEGVEEGQKVISGPYLAISKKLKESTPVEVVSKEKLFEK